MSISCIIPSYNQSQYLNDCLDSLLDQTFRPYEIIVVDDGSTDNSLEIARSYKNWGVKVISQVNKGLSSARNTGLMNAHGDYCLFLDADDILLPNAIDKLQEVIGDTEADIVAPSFKEFGIRQTVIQLMPSPKLEDFKVGNRVGYCQAIRRSALLEVGGYSPRMIWGYEDMALTINLLTRGKKLVTIPDILWLYRTKEVSMITESLKHHKELMAQIYKDFPEFGNQNIPNPLPNA